MYKDAIDITWRAVAVIWVIAGALYLAAVLFASSADANGPGCTAQIFMCVSNTQIVHYGGILALIILGTLTVLTGLGTFLAMLVHGKRERNKQNTKISEENTADNMVNPSDTQE